MSISNTKVFKTIIPSDYLGPLINIGTTSDITATNPNPSNSSYFVWSTNAGTKTITKYDANMLVLMDNISITHNTVLVTSGGSGANGTFNYVINLNDSTDQIVNRYCRFQFNFKYSGAGISRLVVNVTVTTSWMSNPKSISITYSSGITSGTKSSPVFNVDWSDPVGLTYQY